MAADALPDVPPFFLTLGGGDQPRGAESVAGVVLGHDMGRFIVDRGVVVAVDPYGVEIDLFVNSSASLFVATLLDFASWYGVRSSDEDVMAHAAAFEMRLKGADAAALTTNAAWWPLVLE